MYKAKYSVYRAESLFNSCILLKRTLQNYILLFLTSFFALGTSSRVWCNLSMEKCRKAPTTTHNVLKLFSLDKYCENNIICIIYKCVCYVYALQIHINAHTYVHKHTHTHRCINKTTCTCTQTHKNPNAQIHIR